MKGSYAHRPYDAPGEKRRHVEVTGPKETDLLLPFEVRVLWRDYKEYYKTKRQNFLSTIQLFPQIWKCFQLLDQSWRRQFDDLRRLRDPALMFPGVLFMNAHAKFRLSLELGFSACLGEAWDLLRGAIESIAHAHKIIREPNLLKVWIEKDDGEEQAKEFEKVFVHDKKVSLFPAVQGLDKLHDYWSRYSEWGTHTTVKSMAQRFVSLETPTDVEWRLVYTGADPKVMALCLLDMLWASQLMENLLYTSFENRLQFDTQLCQMRHDFQRHWELARSDVIKRLNIQPPVILP